MEYETIFENRRPEYVHVCESGSKKLVDLAPGQNFKVTATDPQKTYARFSRIVYEPDGGVTLHDNKEWRHPDLLPTQFVTEIFNEGRVEHERIECNGQWHSCYKGIPKYVYPDITCRNLVLYSEIKIVVTLVKKSDPINPMYLLQDFKVEKVKKLRPKKDLERIREMLVEKGIGGKEFMREVDEAIQNAK